MKTLVISPTYNERKNIKLLVDMVLGNYPDFDLLIIDDSSPDGTSEKVKDLQSKYENLYLEIRGKKLGLGTAYIYGFKWALDHKYDRIVQMDADLSHNPKDLPMLVKNLDEYDLVIIIQVFEHLLNPIDALKKLRKHIKKYLFIEVPGSITKLQSMHMAHIFYFSLNTLSHIVTKCGFKRIYIDYKWGHVNDMVYALFEKTDKIWSFY